MRCRNPWAINIRVEWILTTVMFRLHATDLITLAQGTVWDTIRVPGTSGRHEFKTTTGMFFSIAGSTVAGCKTLAPKQANSAASANDIVLTRCAPANRPGAQGRTPSTPVQIW